MHMMNQNNQFLEHSCQSGFSYAILLQIEKSQLSMWNRGLWIKKKNQTVKDGMKRAVEELWVKSFLHKQES